MQNATQNATNACNIKRFKSETPGISQISVLCTHPVYVSQDIFRTYLSRVRRCKILKLSRTTWGAQWALRRLQTQFKKSNYRCHARKHVDQNVITNNYSRWETKGEEKNHKNNFIVSYSMTGIFFPSKAIRFVTGHDGNLKQSRIMQLYHNVLSATNHRVALCY